jgi:general nucleoside transport system ATP-binding protein
MPLLELAGVSKRFGAVAALTDINLGVERGEVHCLLGENGAGKSTLCNLIFGVHRPTSGRITYGGVPFAPEGPADALRQGIGMVHQHFSLVGTMTVVENLMMGRTGAILDTSQVIARMKRLAGEYRLEVDPWRVVRDLSVGERQQVEIIKCLLGDPRLLVLDEPTAVLPPGEIDAFLAVCRRVADDGRAVILVTHKLAEISKVADRTTVLRQGTVIETVPMAGADMRALVRSMIGHEIQAGGDGVLAATLGLADALSDGSAQPAQKPAAGAKGGAPALELKGVSFCDASGVTRLDDISLQVRPGEVVGIAGVEGNGQSELGAILAGLARASGGSIVVDGTDLTAASPKEITACGVGIVPEDRHAVAVVSELSIAENMFLGATGRFSRFGLLDRAAMKKQAAALMREFDVRGSTADAPMSSLSGGNQQKAVLARELTLSPLKLLLAAQPTRGLDVSAVEAVYGRIRTARDKGLGVLLISSELNELIAVSDRVAVMYRGRIVGEVEATASNREAIGSMMSGHA